jgi:hypothetical protein
MSDQIWYVRHRTKVSGPFSLDQLEPLRRRGQLARFDQVSQDRQTWVAASTLTELFASQATSASYELDSTPGPVSPPSPACWHYQNGQTAVGPISEQELLGLLKTGKVHPDTLVWKEGMPGWTPCSQIPTFGLSCPIPVAIMNQGDARNRESHVASRTSGLAIASLVLGILWVCGIGALLATVFGAVAINQISQSNGKLTGKGMAIAGLVLGIIGLALCLLPLFLPGPVWVVPMYLPSP